jgi:CDP-diacylglycerol--glycerol-3-phosphate 3-phosphatidyltransferase
VLGSWLDHRLDPLVYKLVPKKSGRAPDPNLLSFLGCFFNLVAGIVFALGYLTWSGLLLLAGGGCDMLDGAIARQESRVTPLGGFLDSVLDRYSDQFAFLGILIFFAGNQQIVWVIVTAIAIIGTTITPYVRARAEIIIDNCQTGILERPERLLILALGALTGFLPDAVLVIAVFSNITAFQRIVYTFKKINRRTL